MHDNGGRVARVRVVIVGRAKDRQRIREAIASGRVEVVDEAASLGDARQSPGQAEAFVVATTGSAAGTDAMAAEVLTAREVEVLELLAEGLPNKAIADRLGISDQTVKFHVASIGGKLGAHNRTEAVRIAIRRGLVAI